MSAFQSVRGALAYSLHRPRYPDKLIDLACSNLSSHELALDVACGSGQLTHALSTRFEKVIGIDRSKAQLEKAVKGNFLRKLFIFSFFFQHSSTNRNIQVYL